VVNLREFDRAAGFVINEIETVNAEQSVRAAIDKGYPLFRGEDVPVRYSKESIVSALTAMSIDFSAIYNIVAPRLEKVADDIRYTDMQLKDMSINAFKTFVSLSYTGNLRILGNRYSDYDILFYDTADELRNAYNYNGLLVASPSVTSKVAVATFEAVDGIYNSSSGINKINRGVYAFSWINNPVLKIQLSSLSKINTLKFVSVMPVGLAVKEIILDDGSIDFESTNYFGSNFIQFDDAYTSSITVIFDLPPIDMVYGGKNLGILINSRQKDLLTKRPDDLASMIPSTIGGAQRDAGNVYIVVLRDLSVEYNQYYDDGYAYFDIGSYSDIYSSVTISGTDPLAFKSTTTMARVNPVVPSLVAWNE